MEWLSLLASGSRGPRFAFAVSSAPQRPRRTARSTRFKRAQSLRDNRAFALIEPLMRFISQRVYA